MILRYVYIFLFGIFASLNTGAQPFNVIDDYFENIFSGNYPKAKQVLLILKKDYPNSLKTKLIFASYYSLMYETTGNNEKYIIRCKKYADGAVRQSEKKQILSNEDVFRIISAKSILLKIDIQKKNYLKAAKNMQSVTKHFEYAIKHKEDDKMKFISGMYRYYVETAKEDYPVIYPVLLFYPSGDKEEGLKLLKECTNSEDKNIKARSLFQLALIYYRDEKNISKSMLYFNKLLKKYPNNLIWQTEYLKALKKYHLTENYKVRQQIIKDILSKDTLLSDEQKKYFIKAAEL